MPKHVISRRFCRKLLEYESNQAGVYKMRKKEFLDVLAELGEEYKSFHSKNMSFIKKKCRLTIER